MAQKELKTRIMPDFVGIARDMDDLFLPEDCGDDELVIRKGRIVSRSDGSVDCVLAFAKSLGLDGLRLVSKRKDGWRLDMGGTSCDNRILEAISGVIGQPSP